MQILLREFGSGAGAINGVCVFTFSLVNVLIMGILGAIRRFAEKHGIDQRIAYRIALCMEKLRKTVKLRYMTEERF